MIPDGWTDDGVELRAPNGIGVVKRFREYLLSQQWDAENWPLRSEYASVCREIETGEVSPGVRQDFRVGSLGWSQKWGFHPINVVQESLALQSALAEAEEQIAALQVENAALHSAIMVTQEAKGDIQAIVILPDRTDGMRAGE